MKRSQSTATAAAVLAVALIPLPVAHAEDTVTYDIHSDSVGILAAVQYRDVTGKHLLRNVPLPWTLTVPVTEATSPTAAGAELRADWRPEVRGAAPVRRGFDGRLCAGRFSR